MKIVEVGIELDKPIEYYLNMLVKQGLENTFNCNTHDIYYTNKENFNGLTENQIKNSCVRIRNLKGINGTKFNLKTSFMCEICNYNIFDNLAENRFLIKEQQIKEFENKMLLAGWKKVFDTKKVDYQFSNGIQLQDIENVGNLVYYCGPKQYYELDEEKQYELLVNELKNYGFTFKKLPGLDKLKTLYYNKKCYSKNQNG
jgi:hypothetical protein